MDVVANIGLATRGNVLCGMRSVSRHGMPSEQTDSHLSRAAAAFVFEPPLVRRADMDVLSRCWNVGPKLCARKARKTMCAGLQAIEVNDTHSYPSLSDACHAYNCDTKLLIL